MNQKEFIEALFETKKFKTKKQTKEFVDTFLEILKENIKNQEKVQFNNFGTFRVIKSEKNIYIPKKNEKIKKEFINIKFKASNNIKKIIKENTEENK